MSSEYSTYKTDWLTFETRTSDEAISSQRRTEIANNDSGTEVDANNFDIPYGGVDLFYSIHANVAGSESVTGSEVFYYDGNDIRSDNSRNVSSLGLSMYAYEIFPEYDFANWRGIKKDTQTAVGSIYVLRNTDMPSILLETEFITNEEASTAMNTVDYEITAGWGIARGVLSANAEAIGYIDNIIDSDESLTTYYIGLDEIHSNTILLKNPNENFSLHEIELDYVDIHMADRSYLILEEKVKVSNINSNVYCNEGCNIFEAPESELFGTPGKISFLGGKIVQSDLACILVSQSGELEITNSDFNPNNEGFIVVTNGGTLKIGDDVNFQVSTAGDANGRGLRLYEGATVELGDNARITVEPGAKVLAQGTEQSPVRFIRADPSKKWGKILLNSSAGNHFEWVLFDGGTENVWIASKNNTFTHITSRNAWRGITGWHNQDGSGNAEAEISYALIEDNTSVGVVSHYLDLDMSYTTIRNNAQAGLYILSNTVYPFHHNVVTNNGQVQTYRDGIEVNSSGTLYLQAGNLGRGYNEIFNNPDDQISGSGDMYLGMLYPGSGGFNSIRGNYSGSKYLVDNNSGVTVKAQNNHWGSSSPVSAMFDGNVNSSYYFSYNPTSGSGNGHDGQAPSKVASGGMDFIAAYEEAENDLETAKTTQEVRDGLYRLYQLSGLSGDDVLKGRFNQLASEVSTGANRVFSSDTHQETLQHSAMILQAKSLVRDKKYEELAGYLDQAEASVLKGMDRRDWLHLTAISQTYHGNYGQALKTIEAYEAHQKAQGISVEEYEQVHQPLEEDLRARLEASDGKSEEDQHSDEDQRSEEITSSEELSLGNYPNPFNPTTNITFTLPNRSQVSLVVYDLLGREVATLVNEILPAGKQTARFDASNLANGVYLYKLRAGNQEIIRKMTLIK